MDVQRVDAGRCSGYQMTRSALSKFDQAKALPPRQQCSP